MRYLQMNHEVTAVTSLDGNSIPCSYLEHALFSFSNHLCAGFHYVFTKYVPQRSYSKGYGIRTAINRFLDFVVEHSGQSHPDLHIVSFERIGAEEYRSFEQYLQRNNLSTDLAVRLKGVLVNTARSFNDGMPLLTLPLIAAPPSVPREPLSEAAYEQLTEFLKGYVDKLRAKVEFRRTVEQGVPYEKYEVREFCRELAELPPEKIANQERNKTTHRPIAWTINPVRALATVQQCGHPFYVPLRYFTARYDDALNKTLSSTGREPVDFVYAVCRDGGALRRYSPNSIEFEELLDLYYPTLTDQVAVALFLMLQTGWNKETVLALNKDNHQHVLTIASTNQKLLIVSEKQKSQSTNLPYFKPKQFSAFTDKTDKYSSYNLIQLAKALSEPLGNKPRDAYASNPRRPANPLFLGTRNLRGWMNESEKHPGRVASLTAQAAWNEAVRELLSLANIIDSGERLQSAEDLEGRLRVTLIQYVRNKRRHPLSVIALEQGHSNVETTDVSYDSSGAAMARRRVRLRAAQEELMSMFRDGEFQGLLANHDFDVAKVSQFRVFTIPGHEKPLWACMDSYNPTYPGYAPVKDARCSRVEKCLFCSQVCILEDSLPYLMERLALLQRNAERNPDFDADANAEMTIIQYVLDSWDDQGALDTARSYLGHYDALLPVDMRSLRIFFED